MEYDDERSGTFEPLRHVPQDKLVVLGLVTTKHGELESKDALKARLDDAVAVRRPRPGLHLPAVRLLLDVRGQLALSVDQEKAKLALLVELADEVWG